MDDLLKSIRNSIVSWAVPPILTGIAGLFTGSFILILEFASAHTKEALIWGSFIFFLGLFFGALFSRRISAKKLAEKDSEIDKLRKNKRIMDSLFQEFSSLTHDEQRSVVDVYLSEPRGIEPTDEQRARMGDWVKMKDFLRRDPVTDTLHLKDDGVRRMLLENPVHVYDLMAARVADLESRLEDCRTAEQPTDEAADGVATGDGSTKAVRTISGSLVCSSDALEAFSPDMAAAAVDSFDSGGDVPIGDYEKAVSDSVSRHDDVFAVSDDNLTWSEVGEDPRTFRLTDRWRSYIDNAEVLKLLRRRAEQSGIRLAAKARQTVHEEFVPMTDAEIDAIWNGTVAGNEQ